MGYEINSTDTELLFIAFYDPTMECIRCSKCLGNR